MSKTLIVWHPECPGTKVIVKRNWFQRLIYPKKFASIFEKMDGNVPSLECYGYSYMDQGKPELEKYLEEDKFQYGSIGVYFHGELESMIGYDIPLFRMPTNYVFKPISTDDFNMWKAEKERRHPGIKEGVYDILVHVFGNDEPIIAKAYIWDGKNNMHFKRGYIVLPDDKESNIFALDQFIKKDQYL